MSLCLRPKNRKIATSLSNNFEYEKQDLVSAWAVMICYGKMAETYLGGMNYVEHLSVLEGFRFSDIKTQGIDKKLC